MTARSARADVRPVAVLALLLAMPAVLAQEAPATPQAEAGDQAAPEQGAAWPASFLVYRPSPDALDDPLSTPLAPPPFDAPRLPATRIDRALDASSAPENAPESAPAHYREMLRLVQQAEAGGSPLTLILGADVAPGKLALRVEARANRDAAPASVNVSLVVFEHGVDAAGRTEPYVARFALDPTRLPVPGNASLEARIDPAWNVDRLGVVAVALADGRALQSATWLPRQDVPTVQVAKAPLVEHVTASWCEPCRASDDAFLLLATQRGAAGALEVAGHAGYLRAPTGWLWAGLALGAVAAALVLRGGRRA